MKKPLVLCILDGCGLREESDGNAFKNAHKPTLDMLFDKYPHSILQASGPYVGLPEGQMGTSEVGHMNLGSGRIALQPLQAITESINSHEIFNNQEILDVLDHVKKNNSNLHIMGLLSDGGIHSHINHLLALLDICKENNVKNICVDVFTDGRDTYEKSALTYLDILDKKLKEVGGQITTINGRYYAMDRDNRWDRVELAYKSLVTGEGVQAEDPVAAVQASYDKEVYDEFILPTVITENGKPVSLVKPNDSVIFFNFRPDRAREITRAFCCDDFDGFNRPNGRFPLVYVCFKDYDESIPNKIVAFKKEEIDNTFGEYLAANGKTQVRLAETEKYAHVTFFFNGGVEEPNKGEDRILVKSPAVATYDLQPEMSAPEVCEKLVDAIGSDKYDVIIINFANPDMVGHTGVIPAAIKAVETVDACVGKAVEAVKKADGVLFICADHGNAEQMINYETGEPHTAHTTNPVPFVLVNYDESYGLREGGCLADIAPTLLEIMELPQPKEMTGKSLLIKK